MNVRTAFATLEVAITLSALALADAPTGKIVSVSSDQIKISVDGGKESSYTLADKVKVMLNNKESSVDKLTTGDTATLTVETKDGKTSVTVIEAKSAETKKAKNLSPRSEYDARLRAAQALVR